MNGMFSSINSLAAINPSDVLDCSGKVCVVTTIEPLIIVELINAILDVIEVTALGETVMLGYVNNVAPRFEITAFISSTLNPVL